MKLGTKGRYAVMSMVDIACHDDKEAVSLNDIATRTEISLPYLEQLFMKLRKSGLVTSVRGPGGGYKLARPSNNIRISDILLAVDVQIHTTRCEPNSAMGCRINHGRCLTHDLWDAMGRQMALFLNSVTLEDVVQGRLIEKSMHHVKKEEQENILKVVS
ncbi:MAG: Rrf2 family transcriptional regulator [Alphaproteobacteria bacterium]|nr:Rrf2 family transcriptional regulator [Alphaproteobacteria bacterium]